MLMSAAPNHVCGSAQENECVVLAGIDTRASDLVQYATINGRSV